MAESEPSRRCTIYRAAGYQGILYSYTGSSTHWSEISLPVMGDGHGKKKKKGTKHRIDTCFPRGASGQEELLHWR